MARRPRVRTGTPGGCLFNGCLTVLVLLLTAVFGGLVWLETQPARAEDRAREDLRENVATHRERLGEAAADGSLPDGEIAGVFRPAKPAGGFVGATRQDGAVTVVAELAGQGQAAGIPFPTSRWVTGCYAFEVPPPASGPPRPSLRELPPEACGERATTPPAPGRPDRARSGKVGKPFEKVLTRGAGDTPPGRSAHLSGTLVVTDDRCVAVRTHAGAVPTAVAWGHGWSVREEDGEAAVYGPKGGLYAREGDRVGLDGAGSERFAGRPCADGTVFEAHDEQAGS
ncbi:hypothetical protein [Streptomyces roseolus]|uniref:hypothetical protein n=1 Tax=Streptomyces roseolus TaxID=67358 RepID=UPI0016746E47|nr:hypothetical protein [Streptomyces roseolus]GGR19029.1 hypothetical protein GCM10010282_09100 [Streptomyces roseolus]